MAHTVTVTVDNKHVQRMMTNYGMITGTVDITRYDATTYGALTGITGFFKNGGIRVTFGTSDLGYMFEWYSQATVKVWKNSTGSTPLELASTVDAGAATFIAVGRL